MKVQEDLRGLSYKAQYDILFRNGEEDKINNRLRLPKPSMEAQQKEPTAARIPGSDVYATQILNNWVSREPWTFSDVLVGGFIAGLHLLCFAAPFTFTWHNFWLFAVLYCVVGCLGIDVSFHRQLTHRSFSCPKWLEYVLAYIGTMGLEHDPIVWVQHHRFHHQNCDTPLDPHSTYEGFWFAHYGWLMHSKILDLRAGSEWIVKDLTSDPFYRFLHRTYHFHAIGQYMVLWWWGGWGAVIWGGAVRQVLMWHVTWLVNSACHAWGERPYATGDLSTNNSWLAIPTFGESWHNNHHAFPYSARHGLEWGQVDITWGVICLLKALGLAWDIRLPSEEAKEKLAVASCPAGAEPAPEDYQEQQEGSGGKED